MSKYTTQIRYICETYAGFTESQGYPIKDILTAAAPKVFGFEWPIFDEEYRLPLEIKILKHYYTREIGAETPGLFTLWLDATMNEIMPLYNQLYKSELIKIEPLTRLDWQEGFNKNRNDGETTNTVGVENTENHNTTTDSGETNRADLSTGDGVSYGVTSDTPQNKTLSVTSSEDYLSIPASAAQANKDTNSAIGTSTTTVDDTQQTDGTGKRNTTNDTTRNLKSVEDYIRHFTGNNASRTDSEMLLEFRKTFLNIDQLIIDELAPLFMNIY